MKERSGWRLARLLPLVFGIAAIAGLGAYITLFRSSPGELSKPHKAVAGSSFIRDCNKCHASKDIAVGCLSCHVEIQEQLTKARGYHAQILSGKKPECAHCHSEHNGPDFPLINKVSWEGQDLRQFKHSFADYRLAGKHATLSCEDCHRKHAVPFTLPHFSGHPRLDSYMGLGQECAACHQDPHAGGLAKDCAKCHGQDAFKPTPFFDHEKFFSLKGGHAGLKCAQCHIVPPAAAAGSQTGARGFPFNRVKGTRCQDCHQNPHKAEWGRTCESCHAAVEPWKAADARMTRALHALTGFRLQAPHDKVSCQQCHSVSASFKIKYSDPRTGRPRVERDCESCHKDPHAGQFLAQHPHCADCHSPRAFKPARFSAADHQSYPLVGGHATAACNSCHLKDPRTGARIFKGLKTACASCHADPHVGQFRVNGATRCENCHQSPQSWKKLSFDHNTQSIFKLDASHRDVACKDCHPTVALRDGRKIVQYKPIPTRCEDCHTVGQ